MARLDWSRLHSKILRSSVWLEDPMVRLVWICALADSETDGVFYGSYETLGRAWNLPVEAVTSSLEKLMAPDPRSGTKEHEGRRIEWDGSNAWRVLNKRLYNPSGEPQGSSTPRVEKHRYMKRLETSETGNGGNGRNALDKSRLEENRTEKRERERFAPPTLEEVVEYGKEIPGLNASAFHDFYSSKGWKIGSSSMKDWRAAARRWRRRDVEDGRVSTVSVEKEAVRKSQGDEDAEAQRRASRHIKKVEQQRAEYQRLLATDKAAAAAFREKVAAETEDDE